MESPIDSGWVDNLVDPVEHFVESMRQFDLLYE